MTARPVRQAHPVAIQLLAALLAFGGCSRGGDRDEYRVPTAQTAQGRECLIAALRDYVRAEHDLLSPSNSRTTLSVETIMAERRLGERYCLRVAQCQLASMSPQPPETQSEILATEFDDCLTNEAKNKADLDRGTEAPESDN